MKIVSFNINSIRARPHQLIHLRDTIDPDVIGIQETKVNDPEFPIEEIKEIGYHPEFWGQKGHYGVAILSKKKPLDVQKGFAGDTKEDQKDEYIPGAKKRTNILNRNRTTRSINSDENSILSFI